MKLLIRKKKKLPKTFSYDNEEITDPFRIANKFNEYFATIGPNLASQIPSSSTSFKSFLNRTHYESFLIKPVTEKEVEQEMHKFNLSPKVIRQIAPFIRQPLTSIFNK